MVTVSEATRMDRADYYRQHCPQKDRSQCEMALEYMEMFGSITPLEALNAFGCFRLPARISDLREDGYDIVTDRNDGKKKYAIYSFNTDHKSEEGE